MNKNIKKFLALSIMSCIIILTLIGCKKKVTIDGIEFDASKIYNICIAQSDETDAFDNMRKGFVVALKDAGFVEDVNVKYSYENAKGKKEFATQITSAFIDKKPDLIVSIGSLMTEAIKDEKVGNDSTNVVFIGVNNAKNLGIMDSNYMPIYNMTGIIDNHQIESKMKYINDNYKDIKKLGIIYDKNNNSSLFDIDFYKFYATEYEGMDIFTVGITRKDDLYAAIENMDQKNLGAMILLDDPMTNTSLSEIITHFNEKNVVVFSDAKEAIDLGAIEFSKKNNTKYGKDAGNIAANIIKGTKKIKEIQIYTE